MKSDLVKNKLVSLIVSLYIERKYINEDKLMIKLINIGVKKQKNIALNETQRK